MKMIKKLFNVICIVTVLSSVHARSRYSEPFVKDHDKKRSNSDPINVEISSDVYSLESVVRNNDLPIGCEVSTLVQEAKRAIERLHNDICLKKEVLKDQTALQLDAMKTKIEDDIERLKLEGEARARSLKNQLEKESVRLSQVAAKKTLEIVSQAELNAVKMRAQAREDALQQKFTDTGIDIIDGETDQNISKIDAFQTPLYHLQPSKIVHNDGRTITSEWRNLVSREFYKDISFMKKIIVEGEPSEFERQDYLNRFNDQNKWFDKTLSTTRYLHDANYEQIVQKKNELHKIVEAQKDADRYFEKVSQNLSLHDGEVKKIRLMVLYDLHQLLEQNPRAAQPEITRLVNRILDEYSLTFRKVSAQFSDIEIKDDFKTMAVVSPQLKSLEEKLHKTKQRLTVEKSKKRQLKADAIKKLHEKALSYIELQVDFEKLHAQLKHAETSMYKAQVKAKQELMRKNDLLHQLEACEQENISLSVQCEKSKEYVAHIKRDKTTEVSHIKHELQERLEQQREKYVELKTAFDHAVLTAQKHENKATALGEEVEIVREKLIETKLKLEETKALAKHQSQLREEAQSDVKLVRDVAKETLAEAREYIENKRFEIDEKRLDLRQREINLKDERQALIQEREKFEQENKDVQPDREFVHEKEKVVAKTMLTPVAVEFEGKSNE